MTNDEILAHLKQKYPGLMSWSPDRRAVAGLESADFIKKALLARLDRKEKQYRTRETTADILHISRNLMTRLIAVNREDPQLLAEIRKGKKTVSSAFHYLQSQGKLLGYPGGKKKTAPRIPDSRYRATPLRVAETLFEEAELEKLEAIIDGKIEAFLDVANALWQIRERKLFLDTHGRFALYLRDRWGVPFRHERSVMVGIDSPQIARVGQEAK